MGGFTRGQRGPDIGGRETDISLRRRATLEAGFTELWVTVLLMLRQGSAGQRVVPPTPAPPTGLLWAQWKRCRSATRLSLPLRAKAPDVSPAWRTTLPLTRLPLVRRHGDRFASERQNAMPVSPLSPLHFLRPVGSGNTITPSLNTAAPAPEESFVPWGPWGGGGSGHLTLSLTHLSSSSSS